MHRPRTLNPTMGNGGTRGVPLDVRGHEVLCRGQDLHVLRADELQLPRHALQPAQHQVLALSEDESPSVPTSSGGPICMTARREKLAWPVAQFGCLSELRTLCRGSYASWISSSYDVSTAFGHTGRVARLASALTASAPHVTKPLQGSEL